MDPKAKIRVLVIEDTAIGRKILTDHLSIDPQIEVIGAAPDPLAAIEMVIRDRPDVILLDIEMSGMDGVTFLKMYMPHHPIPSVVVSSLSDKAKKESIDVLEAGAVDLVTKSVPGGYTWLAMMGNLRNRIKQAAIAHSRLKPDHLKESKIVVPPINETRAHIKDRIIAMGSSAGGVSALGRIIPAFPRNSPGIVIVQHMPGGYTKSFAERLDNLSLIRVKEAENGDIIKPGHAFVAPGGEKHLEIHRKSRGYQIVLLDGDKVSGHKPSVDVLFRSVAKNVKHNGIAVLLTGMGADGSAGMLDVRNAGGRTFAQNDETCVVFGMPGEAWEKGAAEELVPLDDIPGRVIKALNKKR